MTRGVGWYLVGSLILVALTGCNPSFVGEQREPWRGEAEQACLKSGAVKESPSVVLLPPINGPGMCGADFPLKVSMLGEGAPLGYEDEPIRPPSSVPQAAPAYPPQPPQYPANPQYGAPYPPPQGYPANPPFAVNPAYPHDTRLPPNPQYGAAPGYQPPPQSPGPSPQYGATAPFAVNPAYPHDTRLPPNASYPPQPGDNQDDYEPAAPYPDAQRAPSPAPAPYEPAAPYPNAQQGPPPAPYQPSAPYSRAPGPNGPISLAPPGYEPPNADAPGDYQAPLPNYGAPNTVPARPPSPRPTHSGPFPPSYPGSGQIVPMSPSQNAAVATTASVSPPATLACPLVSVLDRWIGEAVQPAAQKWFGQPVTGIRQISAYSCRGMNGNPNAHISEHAFGNALDIASFVLADGRVVTVEHGWHGTPEEQGFLRDVQGAACQMFTTVLAPGANVYHYNHIHVDLMRRARRPVICEPGAVAGDEIAARARARYARRDTGVTGAIGAHRDHQVRPSAYSDDDDRGLPDAVAGDD